MLDDDHLRRGSGLAEEVGDLGQVHRVHYDNAVGFAQCRFVRANDDLAGARDIASVIDARIRQRVYPLVPQPQGPWASRVPLLPDPGRQAYLA